MPFSIYTYNFIKKILKLTFQFQLLIVKTVWAELLKSLVSDFWKYLINFYFLNFLYSLKNKDFLIGVTEFKIIVKKFSAKAIYYTLFLFCIDSNSNLEHMNL